MDVDSICPVSTASWTSSGDRHSSLRTIISAHCAPRYDESVLLSFQDGGNLGLLLARTFRRLLDGLTHGARLPGLRPPRARLSASLPDDRAQAPAPGGMGHSGASSAGCEVLADDTLS
jgi:hypothetical protein